MQPGPIGHDLACNSWTLCAEMAYCFSCSTHCANEARIQRNVGSRRSVCFLFCTKSHIIRQDYCWIFVGLLTSNALCRYRGQPSCCNAGRSPTCLFNVSETADFAKLSTSTPARILCCVLCLCSATCVRRRGRRRDTSTCLLRLNHPYYRLQHSGRSDSWIERK
ncbi:hypothetical protein B0H12DRAFT_130374 [Mycena haematopus]|nr:hypothetical protein B0H12DRAFT_130374 [Mycena haematopus]